EEALLPGLLNARRGKEDLRAGAGRADLRDGIGVSTNIFVICTDLGDAGGEGGGELFGGADQDAERRFAFRVVPASVWREQFAPDDRVLRALVLARGIQGEDEFAAQAVEFADGQDDVAREFVRELAEGIRSF